MTVHVECGAVVLVDDRLFRNDPDFVEGIDRDLGGAVLLFGFLVDLVPEFLPEFAFRIY